LNYGKFFTSPYPFLLWEPQDQWKIWNISETYLNYKTHSQGFRFSINIDQVQFELYAGLKSKRALNHELIKGGTKPMVTTIHYKDHAEILSFWLWNSKYYYNSVSSFHVIPKEISFRPKELNLDPTHDEYFVEHFSHRNKFKFNY
jgi:hypothetical protein